MNRLQKSVQIEQPALSLVGQRGWSIAPPARKKWFGSLPGPVVGIRDQVFQLTLARARKRSGHR